jgi:hypothetical protein
MRIRDPGKMCGPCHTVPQSRRSTRATGEFLDTPDSSDILVKPSWDTSDNNLPAFLEALYKYLPKKDPRYRNWVEYRYVVSGRYTNTVSFNHIDRLINHSIVKGTFAAPRIILSTDMEPYGVLVCLCAPPADPPMCVSA